MTKEEIIERVKGFRVIKDDETLDKDFRYGFYKDCDAMVDSEDVNMRIRIASLGYGLDKLKNDEDPRVRLEVAKKGFYRDLFLKDPSEEVRLEAEKH